MTSTGTTSAASVDRRIIDVVKRFWGFDTLRPLQADAIRAGLDHRDSLVVMPTGGGKSLCYQVPPVVANRVDIVISPLISLMKDQVDGLRSNGYPAAALHSGLSPDDRAAALNGLKREQFRLLFISPERLIGAGFLDVVEHMNVRAFAIDEAHCISHWGHDFRPEYRQLAQLKRRFPQASVHAFTATATPRVRQDIVNQLGLVNANVLVGRFDRPNLAYRIVPRFDRERQIIEIIRRHPREAVIVYCITRKDTESVAAVLKANGINAAHYHAGMTPDQRRRTQDAFAGETLDVVVATVAFGMGIDRSDVRCVIHAAMPKTIEHYQQETGRAGRDGLEAECVLLHSAGDAAKWRMLIEKSAEEASEPAEVIRAQIELLNHMDGLCTSMECRHRALTKYFGQNYEPPPPDASDGSSRGEPSIRGRGIRGCGACDICLDEVESMPDSAVIAQKIVSCVARMKRPFGIGHIVQVLRGATTKQVLDWRHDELSTHGLLKELDDKVLTNLVYQLVNQGVLDRTADERPVVSLNDESVAVMKGDRVVRFVEPRVGAVRKSRAAEVSWEGVDRDLFEHLRELRKAIAAEREVPAFVIFGDRTLRSMARIRPADMANMKRVHGIGETKLQDLGGRFAQAIAEFCAARGMSTNEAAEALGDEIVRPRTMRPAAANPQRGMAYGMFERGEPMERIARTIGRAESTVGRYLEQFIEERRIEDVSRWVDAATYATVAAAIDELGMDSLKPVFEKLGQRVPYEQIRVVAAHLRMRSAM